MSTRDVRIVTPVPEGGLMVDADGFLARAELADGTELALVPQMYGSLLLTRGPASGWIGWAEAWTFDTPIAALLAYGALLTDHSVQIDGWIRYVGRHRPTRRRSPCGTCGRILEYGDDQDGVAEQPPACDHGAGVD